MTGSLSQMFIIGFWVNFGVCSDLFAISNL